MIIDATGVILTPGQNGETATETESIKMKAEKLLNVAVMSAIFI